MLPTQADNGIRPYNKGHGLNHNPLVIQGKSLR